MRPVFGGVPVARRVHGPVVDVRAHLRAEELRLAASVGDDLRGELDRWIVLLDAGEDLRVHGWELPEVLGLSIHEDYVVAGDGTVTVVV